MNILDRMIDMFVLPKDQPKVRELLNKKRDCGDDFNIDREIDKYIKGDCIIDDYSEHKLCSCGQCDGYGHMRSSLGYMPCTNQFTIRNRHYLTRNMDKYIDEIQPFVTDQIIRLDSDQWVKNKFYQSIIEYKNRILSNEKAALILCGSHGTGKTFLSACLGYECVEQGHQVYPIYFPDFVEMHRNYEKKHLIERAYKRVEQSYLVIVDELGRQTDYGNKEFFHQAIEQIVRRCYSKRNLIITTNKNREELVGILNSLCIDLLTKKTGYCVSAEDFESKSMRGCK